MPVVKKEKVREDLIDIARNVFGKYGYRKTTMDDIAIAARRGKTSLYYYYSSKEEIFQAVIEKEAELLKSNIINAISGENNPEDKMRAYVIARMLTLNSLSVFYEAIRHELLDYLDFINQARKHFDREETGIVEQILCEGIEKGVFSVSDSGLSADTIVTVLKGLELQFFVYNTNGTDIQTKLKEIVNLIINGIKRYE
ncbi:MAG: TetR/AcrR family transcriptional regulator [Bacteroidota bacterium]